MQEFYNQIQETHQCYFEKWGIPPNVLYMNKERFFELYEWSRSNNENLSVYLASQIVRNTQVTMIHEFRHDFLWLELRDVLDAISRNVDYIDKSISTNVDINVDAIDGVPEDTLERLMIPHEILGLHLLPNN